jgi:hypothetical protein
LLQLRSPNLQLPFLQSCNCWQAQGVFPMTN